MIELGHFLPGAQLLTVEKGVSETYVGMIEVGERHLNAYVKIQSERELANELLGSVLARKAGLSTPAAFLVQVRREDYPASSRFQLPGLDAICAFATEALSFTSFNRTAALQSPDARKTFIGAWPDWPAVLGFDDWIANGDRHGGNFLIGGPGIVWLIDHGHAFTGPSWQIASLQPQCAVNYRLWNEVIQPNITPEARHAAVPRAVKAAMTFQDIDPDSAIEVAMIRPNLTTEEIQALSDFIRVRSGGVGQRICALLGHPQLPLQDAKP